MINKIMIKKMVTLGIVTALVCGIQNSTHAASESINDFNELASQTNEMIEKVNQPIISVIYGENNEEATVILESTTPEATIYYTLNNGEKIHYTEPLYLTEYTVITTMAVKDHMRNSLSISQPIEIGSEQFYETVISTAYGDNDSSAIVTLSNAVPGSAIYYCLAGGEEMLYTSPVHIESYTELTISSKKSGLYDSLPIILPIQVKHGQVCESSIRVHYSWDYTSAEVVLANAMPEATIYYCLNDGEEQIYIAPIEIMEPARVKVVAKKADMHDSIATVQDIYIVK